MTKSSIYDDTVQPLARSLAKVAFHREGRIPTRPLEGHNNKLGVLKLIACGFANAHNFGARAILLCPPVAS